MPKSCAVSKWRSGSGALLSLSLTSKGREGEPVTWIGALSLLVLSAQSGRHGRLRDTGVTREACGARGRKRGRYPVLTSSALTWEKHPRPPRLNQRSDLEPNTPCFATKPAVETALQSSLAAALGASGAAVCSALLSAFSPGHAWALSTALSPAR